MIKLDTGTLKKLKKRIADRNRRFKKLNAAQKRVVIAKDVILQLNARKLEPAHLYFSFKNDSDSSKGEHVPEDMDLSQATLQTTCHVCGIGALFVAAVEHADELPAKDMVESYDRYDVRKNQYVSVKEFTSAYREDIEKYLGQFFSLEQLELVEDYYERSHITSDSKNSQFPSHMLWNHPILKENNKKKRMLMIMRNIVRNNGTFKHSTEAMPK